MDILLKTTKPARDLCLLVFCLLAFNACTHERKGTVTLKDSSYDVAEFATSKDGFDAPDGLLWKDGRLYMADEGGPAFRIWTNPNDVKTLSTSKDGIESPEDLVMDDEGNIFFTDDDAGGVWKASEKGETSLLAGKDKGLVSTEGIALARSGAILVGDGVAKKVFSVSRSGEVKVFLDSDAGITKPESMAFDEEENLYIADNEENVLYSLSREKELKRIVENREGFSPESIWYADGTLYITDSDNGKLFSYRPAGGLKTIAVFEGAWKKVSGITSDEKGNIYVSVLTHIDNKHSYLLRISKRPDSAATP